VYCADDDPPLAVQPAATAAVPQKPEQPVPMQEVSIMLASVVQEPLLLVADDVSVQVWEYVWVAAGVPVQALLVVQVR